MCELGESTTGDAGLLPVTEDYGGLAVAEEVEPIRSPSGRGEHPGRSCEESGFAGEIPRGLRG